MKCEKHDFHWDIGDPMGCPICHTEARIIKLLEDNAVTYNLVGFGSKILEQTAPLAAPLDKVIALIKGETE